MGTIQCFAGSTGKGCERDAEPLTVGVLPSLTLAVTALAWVSFPTCRGQDSAGMVTTDWAKFREYKDNGLVKDVFSKKSTMDKLQGGADWAAGTGCSCLAGHGAFAQWHGLQRLPVPAHPLRSTYCCGTAAAAAAGVHNQLPTRDPHSSGCSNCCVLLCVLLLCPQAPLALATCATPQPAPPQPRRHSPSLSTARWASTSSTTATSQTLTS